MKKSILVILLVLLAFSLWSVLAIAKDKAAQKPTQVQKTEPNVAPDAFPKVMLPQAQPVRPTKEDFKREVLDRKSWTPETVNNQQVQPLPAANQEAAEKEAMPALCTVGNAHAGGYYHSAAGGNPYFYCWGEELWATYIDPEDSLYGNPMCAQPIYPFMAKQVMMAIYSLTDTAHVLFQPEIREALYDPSGCAYPGAALLTGPVYNLALGAGGVSSVYLSLGDSVCLYKPWFAVMHFINSDDFFDTLNCAPINTSSWFSELFDNSGRTCQSYWNPYGPGGSWYDVTLYAISNGAIRVRTRGYSKTENTCLPPANPWYFKDSLALAPCGVPDIDQAQFPPAYCGPVAEANSYWWLNAKWGFDLAPMDPVALVNQIAAAAGTVPGVGTNCDQLEAAILQVIKAHGAWWFTETTLYKPTFWYLQKELKQCHDVTILLGFWQTPDGGATWYRFGGHFVTVAGVDIFSTPPRFAFSDPALDNAEAMFPNPVFGIVCHTDPFPHVGNPLVHNNPANTSHDFYDAAWPSASPGGYVYLPAYQANWPDFNGQNAGPLPNSGTYNSLYPVQVEVEQVISVWPGSRYISGEVDGSEVYALENNHGGIEGFGALFGATLKSGLYYGTLVVGDNQSDLNADYGDYYPTSTFTPEGPPVNDLFSLPSAAGLDTFMVLNNHFEQSFMTDLDINNYAFGFIIPASADQCPEFGILEVVNLYNNTAAPVTVRVAKWKDWDISASGGTDLADFNQPYQSIWMYPDGADTIFGETEVPHVVGDVPMTGYSLQQNARVYDGQYMDSLYEWMGTLGWGVDNPTTPADRSNFIAGEITIPANSMVVKEYIEWAYNGAIGAGGDASWKTYLYCMLHFLGYYRGDVNVDGKYNVADVIYMINYLFKSGPKPIEFVDQMDVDNNHASNVADVIYSINYLFKGGPAAIDENRPLWNWSGSGVQHKAAAKRVPGLFGVTPWKALHP